MKLQSKGYQLEGAPRSGWHELEVKLKGRKGAEIRARTGYTLSQRRSVNLGSSQK